MKCIRNPYGVISLLLMTLLLASCSYYRQFYIVNESDEECTITVQLNVPVRDYESRDSFLYLDDPGIRIDNETLKHLTKRLDYKILDEYKMEIQLLALSTVFLGGKGSNDPSPYRSVTIKTGDREIVFSDKEILKKFEKTHFFSLVYYYVFE